MLFKKTSTFILALVLSSLLAHHEASAQWQQMLQQQQQQQQQQQMQFMQQMQQQMQEAEELRRNKIFKICLKQDEGVAEVLDLLETRRVTLARQQGREDRRLKKLGFKTDEDYLSDLEAYAQVHPYTLEIANVATVNDAISHFQFQEEQIQTSRDPLPKKHSIALRLHRAYSNEEFFLSQLRNRLADECVYRHDHPQKK